MTKSIPEPQEPSHRSSVSEIVGGPVEFVIRGPLACFEHIGNTHPDAVALICGHQRPGVYGLVSSSGSHKEDASPGPARWPYGVLLKALKQLSLSLNRLGLLPNSSLFVILGNSVEHVLVSLAAYRIGCVHVSMNPQNLANPSVASHMVTTVLEHRKTSRVGFVAQDKRAAARFDALFPDLNCVRISVENGIPGWIPFETLLHSECESAGTKEEDQCHRQQHSETSIFFTSGTTSMPKACSMNLSAWMTALGSRSSLALTSPGDRVMVLVPTSHSFGYMGQMFALTRGATLVFGSYGEFDPKMSINLLRSDGCTHLVMVAALANAFISADLSGIKPLRAAVLSGMGLPIAVAKELQRALAMPQIENIYGMMEGVHFSTGPVNDIQSICTGGYISAGFPSCGATARICAPGTRLPLRRGEPGELHYSGFQLTKGYVGMETNDFFADEDGKRWFNTGDQAIIHTDGQLYIVGRYKDVIVRGGKNVSPSAIESVLNEQHHLQTLNPQVVACPDPIAGEVPVVVVNQPIDKDTILHVIDTIRVKMGPMYVPSKVVSIDMLGQPDYPRTTSGKIQKSKLAALVHAEEESHSSSTPDSSPDIRSTASNKIKELWARTLGISDVDLDIHSRLAERTDSITLMRVHSKARRATGKDVSYTAWASVETIADQMDLFAQSPHMRHIGIKCPRPPLLRPRGPRPEDMVHLSGDPNGFWDTKDLIARKIAPFNLDWDDVESVFPSTDTIDLLHRHNVLNSWEMFISVITTNSDKNALRSAMERTLSVHPMLLSFLVSGDLNVAHGRTLHVNIHPCRNMLDECIVDYGEVDNLHELRYLRENFPKEHRIVPTGLAFKGLVIFVKETNSAALVSNISHASLDGTYQALFMDDLNHALGGDEQLESHLPYKAWAEAYYLFADSAAARPALDYHLAEIEKLQDRRPKIWPGPPTMPEATTKEANNELKQFEFQLPGILSLRRHHPTLTSSVVVKVALALLVMHRTQQPRAIFMNTESARSSFPFLPPSVSDLGSFQAIDVAGPTITINIDIIDYQSTQTVLDLLQQVQEQQESTTKHANAPWHKIFEQAPWAQDLFCGLADTLIFNWTGASTFQEDTAHSVHENIKIKQLFFRPNTRLMVDAGMAGKDGTDVVICLSGLISRISVDSINSIATDLKQITTWLVEGNNWERPVRHYIECLSYFLQ